VSFALVHHSHRIPCTVVMRCWCGGNTAFSLSISRKQSLPERSARYVLFHLACYGGDHPCTRLHSTLAQKVYAYIYIHVIHPPTCTHTRVIHIHTHTHTHTHRLHSTHSHMHPHTPTQLVFTHFTRLSPTRRISLRLPLCSLVTVFHCSLTAHCSLFNVHAHTYTHTHIHTHTHSLTLSLSPHNPHNHTHRWHSTSCNPHFRTCSGCRWAW
jgi:hypothetical protein